MLTVCIATDNSTDWQAVGRHLHGATIESCVEARRWNAPPEGCEAVVFVGASPVEKGSIEHCIAAGKHVLLATEPWLTGVDLTALSDEARNSGVHFGVVNPDRYLPSRQLIHEQLQSKVGEVGLVRIHRWEPVETEAATPWGFPGPLVRDLEMTMWLTGQIPQVVCAVESPGDEHTGAGRVVQVHLGFSAGMALIDLARLPAGDGYHSLSVIGASGAAYADDHQNAQLLYRGGSGRALRTGEGTKHLAAMLQDFTDAIAGSRDVSPTVASWREVFSVAGAARESLATKKAAAISTPSREGA